MIKVGFVTNFSDNWLGGVNYYRNLIDAIYLIPHREIELVLITGKNNRIDLGREFPDLYIIKTSLFDPLSVPWFLRKFTSFILRRDYYLEKILTRNNINILSHVALSKNKFFLPVIGWIPDLQHKYFPELFSKNELNQRNSGIRSTCERSRLIIVSSKESEKDLVRFVPESQKKVRVLPFTVKIPLPDEPADWEAVKKKYGINKPYFLVANQFWAHKNHKVIIDALGMLSGKKGQFQIIVTGNTRDYRNNGYFSGLIDYAEKNNVLKEFVTTGIIPYEDLIILMRHSLALINPSNFEGWNTAVEEAKALGKRVILSDIPVHREQNPARGMYFQPDDVKHLMDCLLWVVSNYNQGEEDKHAQSAYSSWKNSRLEFAQKYQAIVLEALGVYPLAK